MKTFINQAAQGDMLIQRIDSIPECAVEVAPDGADVVVTHSETGHNHVMDRRTTTMYRLPDSIYDCFLLVQEPTPLRHMRPHDTHESIMVPPGAYHVRRQREYTPEGWRRVED